MEAITANGLRMPRLGLDTWGMSGSACQAAVATALGLGYRHIDTAQMYANEDAVGAGMRASGVPRAEIHLTTKVWNDHLEPARMRKAREASLRALGTEYVDLYLIHWPSPSMDLGAALGRLLRALAAVSRFRLGSFSALRELTDTLGAHARAAASEQRIAFTLAASERRIELAAGPFLRGSGSVFTAQGLAHPASPLSVLADELRLEEIEGGEIVRLVVSDRATSGRRP